MNKSTFLALFSLIAIFAGSLQAQAPIQSPSQPKIMLDDNTIVGPSNPMPITSSATIGTATVDPATPPTKNIQETYAAAPVPIAVPSIVNRWSFSIFNPSDTMTVWASLDGAVASATPAPPSIPIPPLGWISMKLDAAKVLSLAASVSTNVTVYQDGF